MRKGESGFSLVELMIGAIVLLVSAGAIVTVLRVSVSLHSKTEQGLELQENVRSALSYICRELINAGSGVPYLTKINGSPAIVVPSGARLGPLGASVDTGYVFFVTPCHSTGEPVTADGEGNALPEPIQTDMLVFLGGMGDTRFVQENSPGPSANWGAIVYLEDNSIFKLGQVILISNGFQVSLGQVTQVLPDGGLRFDSGGMDVLGLNSPADEGTPNPNYYAAQQIPGGPPPEVFPLASITYYLDATTNPAHPMIKRLANSADGAGAGAPLADDIENLKVTFLVDDDANATTPAIRMDAPTTGLLSLVRGITVSITGRSHAKMDNTAYADGHGRLTMSETVFFRNNIRR